MAANSYSELVVKGLLDAFGATKEKLQPDDDPKRNLVRFSFELMQNFLESVADNISTDPDSDQEMIQKAHVSDRGLEKISETNTSVKTPLDRTVFTAPAVCNKRRRKRKVSCKYSRVNTEVQPGPNFDAFEDAQESSLTYSSCTNRFKNLNIQDRQLSDNVTNFSFPNTSDQSIMQVSDSVKKTIWSASSLIQAATKKLPAQRRTRENILEMAESICPQANRYSNPAFFKTLE